MSLLKRDGTKGSIKTGRMKSGLDDEFLLKFPQGLPSLHSAKALSLGENCSWRDIISIKPPS